MTNTLLRLNNKDFNTREQNWLHAVMQYISADKPNMLYSFMLSTYRKCKTQEFADSFDTNFNLQLALGTSMMTQGMGW